VAHVFREVRRVVDAAREGRKAVTVCGELAAEKEAALVLAGLGVNAVSVAPSRFLDVKLALLDATRDECARVARVATE
jgi:phosphoenolpyruvate-protein kinase (PTS system EI component)